MNIKDYIWIQVFDKLERCFPILQNLSFRISFIPLNHCIVPAQKTWPKVDKHVDFRMEEYEWYKAEIWYRSSEDAMRYNYLCDPL